MQICKYVLVNKRKTSIGTQEWGIHKSVRMTEMREQRPSSGTAMTNEFN